MKHILLLGAGKSATVLIDYLKALSEEQVWKVTVADANLTAVAAKVGEHPLTKAIQVDILNINERQNIIQSVDLVISLMPPHLHYLVAQDCILFKKHLLTASYVDDAIKQQAQSIADAGVLFLCEMGLDPGIDHMSAMQLISTIKANGGQIDAFISHCGGLVAPESDDNPWHYKISWNPKNVVMAGKAGAVYKESDTIIEKDYKQMFADCGVVEIPELGLFAYYPNRDSLSYIPLYGLENAATFKRTTLRHPEFCIGWKNIVDLALTNEDKVYQTDGMTIAQFFKSHFEQHGFKDWLNDLLNSRLSYVKNMMEKLMELMEAEEKAIEAGESPDEEILLVDEKGELNALSADEVKTQAAESVAANMHAANISMQQLFFLGLEDETLINKGLCSAADVLQFILENKLVLHPQDKDMIVMLHEIEYTINNSKQKITASLVVKGDDSMHTAMAKTVGLPLGIAAKLILNGSIQTRGLHIPIQPEIYTLVLKELAGYGIQFEERQIDI
jgi:saccharopine dehydrogenase-like NADP-dependent oxidoreductase